MSSRETILQRIRSGLSAPRAVGATAGSSSSAVAPPPVPQIWPRENPEPARMAERFADELAAVSGEVIRCNSMDAARAKLAELMDQSQWSKLGALDAPLLRELTAALPPERLARVDASWQPTDIAQLPAGVIATEKLLADTGSCVVACGTAHERLMCYLPPVCIVVAQIDQLVEHMPAAWDAIARQCAEPDRRGELVIVTGPSRTADIEKILILGVHGPKRLVVFLVG